MRELLNKIRGLRVLVVGDVMVDRYVHCEPTPSGSYREVQSHFSLGGAANVMENVRALSGDDPSPVCVGVVGNDTESRYLCLDLTGTCISDQGRPTTLKTRYLCGNNQLFRCDRECAEPLSRQTEQRLLGLLQSQYVDKEYDAYVLSDYAKGVVTPAVASWAIDKARRANKPVVVDPKGNDWGKYTGATVIKPNKDEAKGINGTYIANIVVTAGAEGMTVYSWSRKEWIPAVTWEGPSDATGAGDTVAAALALALGAGEGLHEAARFANLCAGLVIRKPGTSTVSNQEVREYLDARSNDC